MPAISITAQKRHMRKHAQRKLVMRPHANMQRVSKRSLLELALVSHGPLADAILFNDLPIVEHVKFFRRILASKEHDGLLASWVIGEEVRHLVDIVTDDDPAVAVRRMLRNLG